MSCICCVYAIHILTKIFWYTNYNIWICHVYVVYILYIYWLKYFDIPTKIFWYAMYMLSLYNTYTENLYFQFFQLPYRPFKCAKIKDYSKWDMPCIYKVYTMYMSGINHEITLHYFHWELCCVDKFCLLHLIALNHGMGLLHWNSKKYIKLEFWYTWHIHSIYHTYADCPTYTWNIHGIYRLYTS